MEIGKRFSKFVNVLYGLTSCGHACTTNQGHTRIRVFQTPVRMRKR